MVRVILSGAAFSWVSFLGEIELVRACGPSRCNERIPMKHSDIDLNDLDTFDVTRDPNPQLLFGIGEHFCLGANLARMELQKIFAGLMKRLPDIERAAEPRRLRSNFINGVKEMRVSLTPTAKSSA